eukprot:m.247141 g.247141  ORF g.247141 m.247141 type:complete len:90 (+) comp15389_c11_seq10:98-367(+)
MCCFVVTLALWCCSDTNGTAMELKNGSMLHVQGTPTAQTLSISLNPTVVTGSFEVLRAQLSESTIITLFTEHGLLSLSIQQGSRTNTTE